MLYADSRGVYARLGCDVYGVERDARTYSGDHPVVAHPPCQMWGQLRHLAKRPDEERDLAFHALSVVRSVGGVLEHPRGSHLWPVAGLPLPGAGFDRFNGWSLCLDQSWFGHRARKRTLLYIVGIVPGSVDAIPLSLSRAERTVESMSSKSGEREATPVLFAQWLLSLARRVVSS